MWVILRKLNSYITIFVLIKLIRMRLHEYILVKHVEIKSFYKQTKNARCHNTQHFRFINFFLFVRLFLYSTFTFTQRRKTRHWVSVFILKSKAMCIAGVRFMSSLSIFQYFCHTIRTTTSHWLKYIFFIVTFSRDNKKTK